MSTILLLSSAMRPRYREDILRCIAAPVDAVIQFRYQKKWIACSSPECLTGKEGLVCFIGDATTGPQPLTPVRYVKIEHVSIHGTTVSLQLRAADFALANTSAFTEGVNKIAAGFHPRRIDQSPPEGKWVFPVGLEDITIERSTSLTIWEKLVQELSGEPEFTDEKLFWTVVGIEPIANLSSDYREMKRWPTALKRGSTSSLVVYHYSPSGDPQERSYITVSGGGSVNSLSSSQVPVDSRYDLKRWRFSSLATGYGPEAGWIAINAPTGWGLELPLTTDRAYLRAGGLGLLIGLFLGLPGAAAAFRDLPSIADERFMPASILAGISLIGGILAGLAAVFGIRKSI
jgi:hypothetical protein